MSALPLGVPRAPAVRSRRRAAGGARISGLPPHWPITACIGGFPLWWALGMGSLVWPVFAVPLAVRLVTRRRRIVVPRGTGTWMLFLVVVGLSFFALDADGPPIAWTWRLLNLLSCTVFFLAVCAAEEDEMPTDRLVRLLAGFWIVVVVGGWLGVLLPHSGLPSLTEAVLPGSLTSNEFLQELVRPTFAQVQEVLGYPLGRPKAPFAYTNSWGSAYALLLPFFFMSWLQSADASRRSWAYILLAASLAPVFLSLNRGLWLSLGVALVYAAARAGAVARVARKALLALVTVGMLLIVFTPVRAVVEGRAANDHSSQGRAFLYGEAVRLTSTSPIIGVGGPRPYGGDRLIPLVGTQGTFWMVMVSAGFLGVTLFVASWLRWIRETRSGPTATFWCHVVLIIGFVQIFVYDLLPEGMHIVLLAAAIGVRAARTDPTTTGDTPPLGRPGPP